MLLLLNRFSRFASFFLLFSPSPPLNVHSWRACLRSLTSSFTRSNLQFHSCFTRCLSRSWLHHAHVLLGVVWNLSSRCHWHSHPNSNEMCSHRFCSHYHNFPINIENLNGLSNNNDLDVRNEWGNGSAADAVVCAHSLYINTNITPCSYCHFICHVVLHFFYYLFICLR